MIQSQLRINPGEVFHKLVRQKKCKVLKGHLQPDHSHMLTSIPPKYPVAQTGEYKGKKDQGVKPERAMSSFSTTLHQCGNQVAIPVLAPFVERKIGTIPITSECYHSLP